QRESFLKEFLEFPEIFEPTYQAKKNIVGDFILPLYGHNRYCFSFTNERMREWVSRSFQYGDIKDLKQSVEYGYSSTAGRKRAIHVMTANIRDAKGKYKKVYSDGIVFCLESFVQLKRLNK
ncbi:MAG: hypothetical protein GY928_34620, partial [Colwellia sp.]|nr:hypothetical protein [Colwellia sp.]